MYVCVSGIYDDDIEIITLSKSDFGEFNVENECLFTNITSNLIYNANI